jgi:hypothetical protein
MLSLTVRTVTTDERRDNETPTRTTVTTHRFDGSAHVSLSSGMLSVSDLWCENDRKELVYYADNGEILTAIVEYVAVMQQELQRAADRGESDLVGTRQSTIQRLQRIAGAMGLNYAAPTAAAQAEQEAA